MNKVYLTIAVFLSCLQSFSGELEQLQEKSPSQKNKIFETTEDFASLKFYPNDATYIGASLDYLYWGIKLEGSTYAVSSKDQSQQSFGYDYRSGFRVGVSSIFPDFNNFVVDFVYTYINDRESKTLGSGFRPSFNVGSQFSSEELSTISAASTYSAFKLDFNNLDITLGKYLSFGQWTYFKLYLGLQGAYIENSLDADYSNCSGSAITDGTDLFVDNDTYYWALGIKAGLDSIWYFTKQFGLIGNINISGLASHFSNRRKDSSFYSETTSLADMQDRFYSSTFALDLSLGLRYDHRFKSDKVHAYLSASWEVMIWFDLNRSITFPEESSSSDDLNMQGLTLRAGLNF